MFSPRVAVASLSGESDAAWALAAADYAGAAFLGGIAVDDAARQAARAMVEDRDRTEFLPDDPLAFIDSELAKLEGSGLLAAFNVRSATTPPVQEAAEVCKARDAVVEINAHCRQDELCAAGCGETLLADTERLCAHVEAAAGTGATVSVKVRAEVPGVDLPETTRRLVAAGADFLHVDAMDSEAIIANVVEATDGGAFVIANNGVRDRETAEEYLRYGADAVSIGRPSDNPQVLRRVREAVDGWFGREAIRA